ncbi:MAG: hypothetical protein ABXS92_07195 [Sulfurimonas sp.]
MKKLIATLSLLLLVSTTIIFAKTAGSVNGIKITVAEANQALQTLTEGKMTWGKLKEQEKTELIEMMAPSRLAVVQSKKELVQKEKEAALSSYWMRLKMSQAEVSDKEAKEAYDKMVKFAKKSKSSKKIPPFSQVKENLKLQLKKERVVAKLMEKAKIITY